MKASKDIFLKNSRRGLQALLKPPFVKFKGQKASAIAQLEELEKRLKLQHRNYFPAWPASCN